MNSEPARSLMRFVCLPIQPRPGIAGERLLHHRRRIHERAMAERAELRLEPRRELREPAAQHLVIVAAERVTRDVALAAVGKHAGSGTGIGRGGRHAHADDAQRPRHQRAGPAPALPVARHVVHAAVATLREPALEIGLVLGEIDAGDADLVEAELARQDFDPCADPREFAGGEWACHEGTAASGAASIITRMDPLPAEVYSAASVRAMDRRAIETGGIPGYTLMRRAGDAAFAALRRHWPAARDRGRAVRRRQQRGRRLRRRAPRTGRRARRARHRGVATRRRCGATRRARTATSRPKAGTRRPAARACSRTPTSSSMRCSGRAPTGRSTGDFRAAIEQVNRLDRPVLALDVPSGLDADTGEPQGLAIRATRTIAFIALKSGLLPRRGAGSRRRDRVRRPRRCRTTSARPRAPCCTASTAASRPARCRRGGAPRTRATTAASSSSAGMRCRARRGSRGRPRCAPAPGSSRSRRRAESAAAILAGRPELIVRTPATRAGTRGSLPFRRDRDRPGARPARRPGGRDRRGAEACRACASWTRTR